MYGTYVYVYACTVHIRVCMYSTCAYLYVQCIHGMCVYVYACVLHVSTCMHVRYIRVRVCMYSTSLVPRPSRRGEGRPGTHCARMRVIIAKFT